MRRPSRGLSFRRGMVLCGWFKFDASCMIVHSQLFIHFPFDTDIESLRVSVRSLDQTGQRRWDNGDIASDRLGHLELCNLLRRVVSSCCPTNFYDNTFAQLIDHHTRIPWRHRTSMRRAIINSALCRCRVALPIFAIREPAENEREIIRRS